MSKLFVDDVFEEAEQSDDDDDDDDNKPTLDHHKLFSARGQAGVPPEDREEADKETGEEQETVSATLQRGKS